MPTNNICGIKGINPERAVRGKNREALPGHICHDAPSYHSAGISNLFTEGQFFGGHIIMQINIKNGLIGKHADKSSSQLRCAYRPE